MSRMVRIFAITCALLAAILAALPPAVSEARGVSGDKALLASRDAFFAGDRVKLARQAEKTRGHMLESYVDFWQLRLRLEEAAPGELREFLDRHAGTVLAEQLRRDWLRVLGKNRQWELFRQEYPALVRDDPDVACYALQERWPEQTRFRTRRDQTLLESAAAAAGRLRRGGGRDAAVRGSHAAGPA